MNPPARSRKILVPLLFLAVMVLLCIYHALAAGRVHFVTRVYDGDTFLLDDRRTIRLIGVDAPEVQSSFRDREPFGEESRTYLASLILDKRVSLEIGEPAKDKYGRTLAYVYQGDVLVNGRIIREGWAKAYRRYVHPWRDLFIAYEQEAKSRGLGIWRRQEP